jgi:dihydrofolate reductase
MEMIVALDERGGIAKDGQIPWLGKFPEDMKFFKETTMGHTVFMGRTTFFSLPPRFRPLPYRTNIVYTRTPEKYDNSSDPSFSLFFTDEGPRISCGNPLLNEHHSGKKQKIFIIGGSQIYNQYYYQCNTIWVTRIHDDYQCDTFLNIDKILENYWLSKIVLQGEGFVIEKYSRCEIKRANFSGSEATIAQREVSNWRLSAPRPEPCNGAKRFYDSFPRISTRVETPNGALSEANSKKNKKRCFSDPDEFGKHKLLQSFRLLTDIFTRTTKRVHHKNNENT